MAVTSFQVWRRLLVCLHVISSVSWLSQALGLVALLALSASSPAGETKVAAAEMAEVLDLQVLGFSAMIAALTGFGLAAVTTWGYFHHWWVSTKFVLTVAQLAVGTLVLSQGLVRVAAEARAGTDGPVAPVGVGLGLVAGGLALQVWLSVDKPWGRTPRGQRMQGRQARGRQVQGRLTAAPVPVVAMMVVLPLLDITLHVLLAVPLPYLSVVGLVVALMVRRHRARRGATATAGPAQRSRSSSPAAS